MKLKKLLAVALASVTMVSLLAACGGEEKVYEEIAGTYEGYYKNTDSRSYEGGGQKGSMETTDQVLSDLTLNADKTYSYHMDISTVIFGSLTSGAMDLTLTGTYEAESKGNGVYTVTLSEATSATGPVSAPKDVRGESGTRDDTLTEYHTVTLEDLKTEEYGFSSLISSRSFDLDINMTDDAAFTDPAIGEGTSFMSSFAALEQAKK